MAKGGVVAALSNHDGAYTTTASFRRALGTIGTRVRATRTGIAALQTRVGALQTSVGALQKPVGAFQTSVGAARTGIAAARTRVCAARTGVGAAPHRATTARYRVAAPKTPIADGSRASGRVKVLLGASGHHKSLKKNYAAIKSAPACVDDHPNTRAHRPECVGSARRFMIRTEIRMGTVTKTYIGKIEFFEAHLPIWSVDPASIGIDAAQVATLATFTANARTEYDNLVAIRANARAATQSQKDANNIMYDFGADLIKTIRAFAQTTNNDTVYNDAAIPPPAPPTPLGPPATPKNVNAQLNTAGEIELTWDASRAGGTSFIIERSTTSATGPWTIIGSVEAVDFTDTAVPTGLTSVSYRITANRSAGSSTPTAAVTVPFGNAGASTASSSEDLTLAA
jgi:hypothetical protein